MQKLKLLQTESNVLTENTDDDQHDIQKKMEIEIKKKQLQKQLNDLKSEYAAKSKSRASVTEPSTKHKQGQLLLFILMRLYII